MAKVQVQVQGVMSDLLMTAFQRSVSANSDLQVAVHMCSGATHGLTTVTVRVAVPTLPALSTAVYVTV